MIPAHRALAAVVAEGSPWSHPRWRPLGGHALPTPYLRLLGRLGRPVPVGARPGAELRRPVLFEARDRVLACLALPPPHLSLALFGDDGAGGPVLPSAAARFVHAVLAWRAPIEEALFAPGVLVWTWRNTSLPGAP